MLLVLLLLCDLVSALSLLVLLLLLGDDGMRGRKCDDGRFLRVGGGQGRMPSDGVTLLALAFLLARNRDRSVEDAVGLLDVGYASKPFDQAASEHAGATLSG